eukprot:jgi/Ulvmu1/2978/UM015_0018.1
MVKSCKRRNGARRIRKSPLRRAIEKYTLHPDGEAGDCPDGRSKLLHWIHVVTQHPALDVSAPIKTQHGLPIQSLGAVLAGFCAAAVLTVASGAVARKLTAAQATFQNKWSKLENMVQTSLQSGRTQARRAGALIGSSRKPAANLAKRFLPLTLVAIAATALSNTTGKSATQGVREAFGAAGSAASSRHITRVLNACLAIAGCSVAQCAVTHRPAIGTRDPYRAARARVMNATKHATNGIAQVATARTTRRVAYTAISLKAIQQGLRRRRLILAPAALSLVCAEAAVRDGTDGEFTVIRQRMLPALRAAHARFHAERRRMQTALREFLQASREYCLTHPEHTHAAAASMLLATLLVSAALQVRHSKLRQPSRASARRQPAAVAADATLPVSALAPSEAEHVVAAKEGGDAGWLEAALEQLQRGLQSASTEVVHKAHDAGAALRSVSAGAVHRAQDVGAAVQSAAVGIVQKAQGAGAGLQQRTPTALQHAAEAVEDGAHAATSAVAGVAHEVPEQLGQLVQALGDLVAAAPEDEAGVVTVSRRGARGLDVLAQKVLSPEVLLYGMALSEMHVRGMLPGGERHAVAREKYTHGIVVSGRDIKTALVNAWRATAATVAGVVDRMTKGRVLAQSEHGQSDESAGTGEATISPRTPKGASPAVPDISTPQIHMSRSAAADDGGGSPGVIPHARLFAPSNGEEYRGANPLWMLRGLVAAGVLTPEALEAAMSDTPSTRRVKREAAIEEKISNLCQSVSPSLEAKQVRKLFDLEANFHHLNHGSYGATLRVVSQAADEWRAAAEASPSRFMEEDAVPALMRAVSAAAGLLHARPSDCVPVQNATTGMTTVLRSLELSSNDSVLVLQCAYPAVKTAVGRVAEAAGASVVELQFDAECVMQPALVPERLRAALEAAGGSVRAVVLDHVVSFPPIVLPVKEMAAICREMDAVSIVDGAHAIGNVAMDLGNLGVDAYVTNLHKWLCTPKGTALLWVAEAQQARVRPLVASQGAGLGFVGEHIWSGTADLAAWLAVPAAVEVHKRLGGKAQAKLRQSVLEEGVATLLKKFQVDGKDQPVLIGGENPDSALSGKGAALHVDCTSFPSMAAVRLPEMPGVAATAKAAQELRSRLRHEHAVEAPVIAWEGALWVRVSAAVYNTVADYEALAAAVMAAGERAGSAAQRSMSPLPSMHAFADMQDKRERSHADEALTDTLVGDGTDGGEEEEEEAEGEKAAASEGGASQRDVFSAEDQVKNAADSSEWDTSGKISAMKGGDGNAPWPVGVNLVPDKSGVKVDLQMA